MRFRTSPLRAGNSRHSQGSQPCDLGDTVAPLPRQGLGSGREFHPATFGL